MAGINPSGLYGAVRGLQDVEDRGQRREAFDTDQEIRRTQLGNERELQPLRKRALDLGVQEGQINLDMSRMTKTEREKVAKEIEEARGRQKLLNGALREFMLSSDPQTVADALSKIEPKLVGLKGVRNADKSITLQGTTEGGPPPIDFTTGKNKATGIEYSPDEALSHFAMTALDPIAKLEKEHAEQYGIAKEGAKQSEITRRALEVAGIRADATAAGAAGRKSEAWYSRQHNQIKPVLDSVLKTQGTAGSFIAGYAHENDAALRTVFEERMGEEVEKGVTARASVKVVTDDVRKTFDEAKKLVTESATALRAEQIDPRNKEAVDKAAKAGNADAKRFQRLMGLTEEKLGYGIAKYIQSTLPGK